MSNDRLKFRYVWKHTETGEIKTVLHNFQTIEPVNPVLGMQMDGYSLVNRDFSTGLKDKNGKLIYEGDILECEYGNIWILRFKVDNCHSLSFHLDANFPKTKSQHTLYGHDKYEIIGNIHENPELLKDEK